MAITQPSSQVTTWEPETPFQNEPGYAQAPTVALSEPAFAASRETPFVDEYFEGDTVVSVAPDRPEFLELLAELYDEEFDEVLYQLAEEATAAYDAIAPTGEVDGSGPDPEAFVLQYLAPLQAEAERLLDRIAETVGERDLGSMTEQEVDEALESIELGETGLSPLFEEFLGKVVKKVKKAAKHAWKAAKKVAGKFLPIKVILSRLKALVRPLLNRVLKYALDKLPPTLRPIASRLATRILGKLGEVDTAEEVDAGALAAPDPGVIQEEFDLGIASLLYAADPLEGEIVVAETLPELQGVDEAAMARLHQARERFIQEITDLPPGSDPGPVVERFLPAVLPFVRLGISIIGRPRVVKFLAGLLGKMIQRYVGRQATPALSRAIVDAGLRMVSLEAPSEAEPEPAGTNLAATVEDTVRRVAELGEAYLEDEALLEEAVYDAFEHAVAGNFPPSLLKPTVRQTARLDGTWVMLPFRGRKYYKKFTRPLTAKITPQIARRLRSFDGSSLETFLREHHGVEGEVDAVAHLYEAIPGSRVARIAGAETDVMGLGSVSPQAWRGFHPLTQEAAGLLFGEPELGSPESETHDADGLTLEVGQRLFYLEVTGRPPTPTPASQATFARRRPTQTRVTMGFRGEGTITVRVYLAESDAQELASKVNQGADTASVSAAVIQTAGRTIDDVLAGRYARRIKLIFDDRPPGRRRVWPRRLRALWPRLAARRMGAHILGQVQRAIVSSASFARDLAAATADQKDGVTVVVGLSGIVGLADLGRLLKTPLAGIAAASNVPRLGIAKQASVRVVAGFEG